MTISDDTIKKAVQRYHREYDRYLKLAARVAEICRSEIVEGNAIGRHLYSPVADSPSDGVARVRWFAERYPETPATTNPAPVTQGGRA